MPPEPPDIVSLRVILLFQKHTLHAQHQRPVSGPAAQGGRAAIGAANGPGMQGALRSAKPFSLDVAVLPWSSRGRPQLLLLRLHDLRQAHEIEHNRTDMTTGNTMQTVSSSTASALVAPRSGSAPAGAAVSAYQGYQIIRRNGAVVAFEPNKIAVALMKAFLAVHGTQGAASASVRETVDELTETVVRALLRSRPGGGTFHIEDVQDQVELGLMRGGHHEIARAYVLYRERRAQERAQQAAQAAPQTPVLHVIDGGQRVALDLDRLQRLIENACAGLGADVKPDP